MDQTAGLAADGRSLDRLKLEAGRDPARAARAAASQFEALFMQSLLRGLRDTIPKSGLTGGSSTETYTSMLDQQLAQKMAGRPGGLGEVIARQLSRLYTPNQAAGNGQPAMGGANGALLAATGQGSATATAMAAAGASSGALALIMPKRQRGSAENLATATAAVPANPVGDSGRAPAVRAIDLVRANPKGVSDEVRAAAAAASGLTGRQAGNSTTGIHAASSRQADFVNTMWPHAVAAQRRTGTPAHLVIGQAALESGWGRRQIRLADGSASHNLFGIKAGRNWTGKSVETVTTEFVDGRPIQLRQRFRAYDSYAEAFADWSRLMNRNPRYEGLTRVRHDPGAYAKQMQAAGYATDPAYADKLEKTIRKTLALRQPVI